VFLAPQCAALRRPWMSALLVPVLRVPSSLLVPVVCLVFFLFTAHVQQIGPTVRTVGT
jgi:hypothetical protein